MAQRNVRRRRDSRRPRSGAARATNLPPVTRRCRTALRSHGRRGALCAAAAAPRRRPVDSTACSTWRPAASRPGGDRIAGSSTAATCRAASSAFAAAKTSAAACARSFASSRTCASTPAPPGARPATPFWGRDANVGLSGAFGTTVLGRKPTPLYLTTITFNPFGDSIGFSPSTRQYFGGRDARRHALEQLGLATPTTRADSRCVHFAAKRPKRDRRRPGRNVGASVLVHRPGRSRPPWPGSACATARRRCRPASTTRPRSRSARPTNSRSSSSTARPAASRPTRRPASRPCSTSSAPRCRSATA